MEEQGLGTRRFILIGEIGEVASGAGWGKEDAGADGAEEVTEWVVEVREKRNNNQVPQKLGTDFFPVFCITLGNRNCSSGTEGLSAVVFSLKATCCFTK